MTEDTSAPEGTTSVDVSAGAPPAVAAPEKLKQTVEVRDVGPCKKHVKVTVDREMIDKRLGEKFKEMVFEGHVAGFRPGKAPRKVVERRFGKEVGDQVRTEVLLASLEQLGEEANLNPLSAPDLDPASIELPKEGPLVYEFEVEVRPEFELPPYKGLKIKKPVHTFTAEEIEQEQRRILSPYGQIVPKPEGNAQIGDILVADVTMRHGERTLATLREAQFRVEKQLAFRDGVAHKFAEQVAGANAGDTRVVDIELSSLVADPGLRGETIQATFEVKDVKTLRLPELTHDFLHTFGVHSPDQFRELVEVVLRRRLEHTQRQYAREQVLAQIAAASSWQLPEDLLARQARKALARKALEMQADGISEAEVAGRLRLMQQDILQSTALALKEHFVLQKVAEVEKIDVSEEDLNEEIERLAAQTGESPRRVRARLEREDMLDALAAEMVERKALDLILDSAEYEEVPLTAEDQAPAVATVEAQAVPGEMHDPAATAPAPAAEGEAGAQS